MKELFPKRPAFVRGNCSSLKAVSGLCLVLAMACSDGSGSPPLIGAGGLGGTQPSPGGMPGETAPACNGSPTPGGAGVRRLTRIEFLNSISDLLPGSAAPSDLGSLPTDPAVDGFENQTRALAPNALLVESWSDVAADVARVALKAGPSAILGCAPDGEQELPCVASFVSTFGLKAFRRPPTELETASYVSLYQGLRQELDSAGATELLLQALIQSPQFLYRSELGHPGVAGARPLDGFEIATRISFLVLQTTPDDELLAAAADGTLIRPEGLRMAVQRLLAKHGAVTAFGEFVRQWLELNAVLDRGAHKDPAVYPGWGLENARAALADTQAFAGSVFGAANPTLAMLLQSAGPPGLETEHRVGVLTRVAFLAANARSVSGSPPLRGAAIQRSLLCAPPPAPPADVDRSEPTASTNFGVTNRQRFEARIAPAACKGCHLAMDGIGNGLENYDAIGQFRTVDNGQPVDASGVLIDTGATDGPFNGAKELAARLAESEIAIDCFVLRFFQYAYGRAPVETDTCALERLRQRFVASGGDMVDLVSQMVLSPEFSAVAPWAEVAP